MVGNKYHLKRFSNYSQLIRPRFAVVRSSSNESRERERESGTVTFHLSLFSALAAIVRRECVFFWNFYRELYAIVE